MNKYPTLRRWLTPILPILSLTVSTFIVTHEYARRDRLRDEIGRAETEFERLRMRLPENRRPPAQLNGDRDHDHDHR